MERGLASDDPAQQDEALNKQLTEWTICSPLNAARFVQGMSAGNLREEALRILAQNWGELHPDEALNWSAALSLQSERNTFLTNICLGLAQRDPGASVQMACRNHVDEIGLLENLTQQWAEKELPAALSWATHQPPGQARDALLQRLALVESKTSPAQAASLVVQQMRPGPEQTEAVMSVVQQWAERDWNGAAGWVDRFPEGSLRDRAIIELNSVAQE